MSIRTIDGTASGEINDLIPYGNEAGVAGTNRRDYYVGSSPAEGMTRDATALNLPIAVGVNSEEMAWLKAHPLQPIATFDGAGTVTLKIHAPDMTAEQFLDNLTPYQTWKYSENVETCFSFYAAGTDGKMHEYQFTAVRNHGFYPTITRAIRDNNATDDGKVGIGWDLVPQEEAEMLIRTSTAFQTKLTEVMRDAGVTATYDDYVMEILNNIGQLSFVSGHQEFDEKTGIYTYSQKVQLSDWIKRNLSYILGSSAIIGAALKIAYRALGEYDFAGAKGEYGDPVVASDGTTYEAGR